MAHSVLSKDMVNLVQAMKQAQRFAMTTLDGEYRKHMLSAAHIIAVNAKNLLDTVTTVKARMQSGLGPEDALPGQEMHPTESNTVKAEAEPPQLNQPIESSYYNIQGEVSDRDNVGGSQNSNNVRTGAFVT